MAGTFVAEVGNAIKNAYCTALDSYANYVEEYFTEALPPLQVPVEATRFVHRQFCNREPPSAPPPTFSGGQCVGVFYEVNLFVRINNNPFDFPAWNGTLVGKITAVDTLITNLAPPGNPPAYYVEIVVRHNDGAANYSLLNSGPYPSRPTVTELRVGVRRKDLQPDTCGNPPFVPPAPSPGFNQVNINITYKPTNSNNVTIPAVFLFAPVSVSVRGELIVPFKLEVPIDANLNLKGVINLNTGDINFNFGDQRKLPTGNPCQPDPLPPPEGVPDLPEDIPPPPPNPDPETIERVIRACLVTVTDTGDSITQVFQGQNPDVFVPRLGNIQFEVRIGDSVGWTDELPVKNRRHLIICPWDGGAVRVFGTPSPGVVWEITPIYAESNQVIDLVPFVS